MLNKSTIKTPMGEMLAIADEEFLYLLDFKTSKNLQKKLKEFGNNNKFINKSNKIITNAATQLDKYFSNGLKKFNLPLKFTGTDFQENVWRQLLGIPYGKVKSYKELSAKVGKPKAYRAVASANAANKFAIVVPCHRVINSNGKLGGYAAGLTKKQKLIDLEKNS